ncbi:MAG TPA: 1,4-alpha-glucan branching enzyme, partial [Eubacterium sp.]|nr:1,4-alpha-glucan branching enzyme [Eubacterium sp.]
MHDVQETEKCMSKDFITQDDCYLFGKGTHYEIYNKLGAHLVTKNGRKGVYFAVWAPHAVNVSVIGEFNDWIGFDHNMEMNNESGIWELFVPDVKEGCAYKYVISTQDGRTLYKTDPYGFYSEVRPDTASRVFNVDKYKWKDHDWIAKKSRENHYEQPMSIYECHLGSWKKDFQGPDDEDGFYDYKRLAKELVEYVKKMGYTHVELMGIAEHPYDGSWGYQVTGYYAPTSRYGSPDEFMYLVDAFHQADIAVILDWVPAHFPRDAHGLAMFDGQPLYEYADTRLGEHPDWGTKVFDYSKTEVSNFLIANALFWVEKYHIDGLRVDAVASMLYLDYGRDEGQWVPNKYGDNKNLEAIEFFKHLSSVMNYRNPRAYVIAEESTAWPDVTKDPKDGGLGFSYKWNMGWMHDFLEYTKLDPLFKKGAHNKMTFGLTYCFSENFILVLSHDEVVHLKCSMYNKMPGYPADKFKNLKTAYMFMFGHPGRKLLFMGQEFAQLQEWSEKRSLDWHLLEEPEHKDMQKFVHRLLEMYKKYPALYTETKGYGAFEWINADDNERSIFSFIRKTTEADNKNSVGFVFNFTPMERTDYIVGVPKA